MLSILANQCECQKQQEPYSVSKKSRRVGNSPIPAVDPLAVNGLMSNFIVALTPVTVATVIANGGANVLLPPSRNSQALDPEKCARLQCFPDTNV